ncbi:MAG: DnaB-like helicase C-terminal domain-containing protein [Nitrospiraceae bacterium]
MQKDAILNHGLIYLAKGWSVIPLRANSKLPALDAQDKNPENCVQVFRERQATEAEVRLWAESGFNIGILCGKASKLVIIDIDTAEGLAEYRAFGLPETLCAKTRKGYHFYYKMPEGVDEALYEDWVRMFPSGIDRRSNLFYVVATPSEVEGHKYFWINGIQTPILDLPAVFLKKKASRRELGGAQSNAEGWLAEALTNMAPGNRYVTLTRVIGKLVHDRWAEKDILAFLAPTLQGFNEQGTTNDAFATAQKIIADFQRKDAGKSTITRGPVASTTELTFKTFESHEEEYKRRKMGAHGINIGSPKLDGLMGGLCQEELFVVAARTGTGKTNFLTKTAKHLCAQGKKVVFFSTEMAFDKIWDRYKQYDKTPGDFRQDQFIVCDDPVTRVGQVTAAVNSLKPDIFIFDHINHMAEDYELISSYMHEFKTLAQKNRIPGIVAAQLNRAADFVDNVTGRRVIPRLSMIKGSGTIEQVAAQVLILSDVSQGPDHNEILGHLDKNRYGEKGIVNFVLRKNPYYFQEMED